MDKTILNLGCGKTKIPGLIGVDKKEIEGYVDTVHDLNITPYPFEDKYFGLYPNKGVYAEYIHPNQSFWFLKPFVRTVIFFISLSPTAFERLWCYWVGGATEVSVIMRKN